VSNSLDATGETVIFVQCDVKSYSSQTDLFQSVWKKWGRLDVLIANAGGVDKTSVFNFNRRNAAINDLPAEPNLDCTDVDFKGTVYGTTLATHFMRNNAHGKGGKIIVTGSMIGIYPCQTFPEYCAAKAATHQWVKTMGPILKSKENITVNCVMPGGIETPAMPGFSKAFLPHQMTLRSTLIAGYDVYLDDADNIKTGETIEAAHDKLIEWGHPGYKSGAFSKRTEAVFEPWFELVHGEKSKLPGAIPDWPEAGLQIIAVTGATGSQGGGVINVMMKTSGWKVRAITRDPESDAAKALSARNIEVVQADFDDQASLEKAFEVSLREGLKRVPSC
jgi:NAD(P)-dependent dehydrogenase (short-subunit alcohol dehydrogenase family)